MNVISKITKLILNLTEMIMNALTVALSVVLWPVKILKKTIDVICDDDSGPLGWRLS